MAPTNKMSILRDPSRRQLMIGRDCDRFVHAPFYKYDHFENYMRESQRAIVIVPIRIECFCSRATFADKWSNSV